jgi:HSP20 family protein
MFMEKWQPLKELENMRKEMDRILDELLPTQLRHAGEAWKKGDKGVATPPIDIIDRNGEILVKAEMPGVEKEGLNISLQEDSLTIKGDIRPDPDLKPENYTYSERNYCSYARTIKVPLKVNLEGITATLKDGLLTVRLPKAEELRPRKIQVEVG